MGWADLLASLAGPLQSESLSFQATGHHVISIHFKGTDKNDVLYKTSARGPWGAVTCLGTGPNPRQANEFFLKRWGEKACSSRNWSDVQYQHFALCKFANRETGIPDCVRQAILPKRLQKSSATPLFTRLRVLSPSSLPIHFSASPQARQVIFFLWKSTHWRHKRYLFQLLQQVAKEVEEAR